MKKFISLFTIGLVLLLIACTPVDEGPIEEPVDELQVSFEEKFDFLDDNNYQLEIVILDHQTLFETKVQMSFDGNVSKYVDGSYEAYYSVTGENVTMLEKQGDTYISKASGKLESGLFYYGFEYEMFTKLTDQKYVFNQDAYASLDEFKLLNDEVDSFSNLSIDFDSSNLVKVTFDIILNEVPYLVTLNISNVGQVELVLPV